METIVTPAQRFRDDLLRAKRGKLDWTKDRLADEAGISLPTLRAVLRGDASATYESVEKVTVALGLSMHDIWILPEAAHEQSAE